ncbi:MAG: PA2779 family protein [Bryobacteraceae bacterium]|nr:PA2779 family protein [Bryobacteraceae bacterium]
MRRFFHPGGIMRLFPQRPLAALTTAAMLMTFAAPTTAYSQEHVVPLSEVYGKLQARSEERAKNLEDINRVISHPVVQDTLRKANVNQEQAQRAIAQLNDEELSRLADRARAVEQDVEGGQVVLILALIGIAAVIIALIVVFA